MGGPARNYSRELEDLLHKLERSGEVPALLLHACCAPCSSYVLEYLSRYFSISVLYYNPNIAPEEEYEKRKAELARLVSSMPLGHPVTMIPCTYNGDAFSEIAKGYEDAPEGGARCARCFRLRLREAALVARRFGCDYFTTTLSISPLKDAGLLNTIGEEVGREMGVKHLPADFKKKNGYKRSVELSGEYGLYRQDYCGCVYSKEESRRRRERKDFIASHS